MVFQLTEALADEIIQALENQERHFVIDALNSVLLDADSVSADDDRFYSLREWNSEKGFALRQDFVNSIHSVAVQNSLRYILHSGRGVFRNFKNELKNYPEIEKVWHRYKHHRLRTFVGEWYNELREIWGLEKLEQAPEDYDNLLQDDFIFQKYCPENAQDIIFQFSSAEEDFDSSWPQEIQETVTELWKRQFSAFGLENHIGFICRTVSNEFAGCITAAPVSKRTEKTVVVSSFFVPQKFRGLGIGTELLEKCLSELKALKKEWILLTNVIIPDSMEPLLLRSGFQNSGSGYSAKI